METLRTYYPNTADLLATPPEDLAPLMLKFAKESVQNGMFFPDSVNHVATGTANINPAIHAPGGFEPREIQKIELLLAEVWPWLERNGLIVRQPGINGRNGWMVITAKGQQTSDAQDFDWLKRASAFPKTLLHPSIADKVWVALMRGDLDEAIFAAFKEVEIAVRSAGGFLATDLGVKLMRDAFHTTHGPLTDLTVPEQEREALAHLFAGAIGSYKNPQSHRTVNLTDPQEAQEQVVLASHLLRIVDARRRA